MKQNISIDQLNELSPSAKERLREWAIKADYLQFEDRDDWEHIEKTFLPSIGQMIQFLRDHGWEGIELSYVNRGPAVGFITHCLKGKDAGKWYSAEDDRSSLWSAVKECLEKEGKK